MTVMQAWEETLEFLSPQTLKPFLLTFVNSLGATYLLLFKRFWWLFVTYLAIVWGLPVIEMLLNYKLHLGFLRVIVWNMIGFTIFICARQVIGGATTVNVRPYLRYWFYTFLPLTFLMLIPFGIKLGFLSASSEVQPWIHMLNTLFLGVVFSVVTSSLVVFSLFFFFDVSASWGNLMRALWHGTLMFVYNLPFCVAVFVAYHLVNFLLQPFIALLSGMQVGLFSPAVLGHLLGIVMLLLMPISVCLMGQWYKKRAVEQAELYK